MRRPIQLTTLLILSLCFLVFILSQQSLAYLPVSTETYFDIVVDDARQQLYGANRANDTVDVLSLPDLQLITTVHVGGQPHGMDMDPAGNELAVALYSAGEIAFIDLDSLTVTARITPQDANPNRPNDLVYGRAGRLYSVGDGGSGGDFVHIFDTETKSEITDNIYVMRGRPRIAISEDGNTLFASEHHSPNKIYRLDVTTDTITETHASPHGPVSSRVIDTTPTGDRVFTSKGQVWSGDLSTLLGNFDLTTGPTLFIVSTDVVYVPLVDRVFITITNAEGMGHLLEFDAATYQRLHHYPLGPVGANAPRINEAGTILYVSTQSGVRAFPVNLQIVAYLPAISFKFCPDFFDEFDNPASGWPIVDNPNVRTEYLAGEYRVLSRQPGFLYLFAVPSFCQVQHYHVSVDARWEVATGNSSGILFGVIGNYEQFYLFEINTDYRLYRLIYYDGNNFQTVVPPTMTTAIVNNNKLRVEVENNQVRLQINGSPVNTLHHLPGFSGPTTAGIISSSYSDDPTSDARFDNFRFERIQPITNTSLAPLHSQLDGPSAEPFQAIQQNLSWNE